MASKEAATILAASEGHLVEEEGEKALAAAKEALLICRQAGDVAGLAESARAIGRALCYQGKRMEADAAVRLELDRAEGQPTLLLALAEINTEQCGAKGRKEAFSLATQAQEKFSTAGDKKMEALANLALANLHVKAGGDQRKGAEEALVLAKRAKDVFAKWGDKMGHGAALHAMAAAHFKAKSAKDEIEAGAWLATAKEAAQLYSEQRLRKLEAWERCCIAQWTLVDNPRKALRLAEEALKLTREIGSAQEAVALGLVVNCHLEIKDTSKAWMMKEASEAVKVAKEGLKRFRSKGDTFGEGQALMALLLAYMAKGEDVQARKICEQARAVFQARGDSSSETLLLKVASQLCVKASQPGMAVGCAQEALKLASGFEEMFLAMESLFEMLLRSGNPQAAMDTAKKLQALAEGAGDKRRAAVARLLRSNASMQMEDFVEAMTAAREAQALFHDLDFVGEEAEALRVVAEVQVAGRNYEAGQRAAVRARKLMIEAGSAEGEAGVAFLLVQIQLLLLTQDRGELLPDPKVDADFAADLSEAQESAEEAVALAKKVGNETLAAAVFCTLAQILTASSEAERALLALDEAAAIYRSAEDQANLAAAMCIESDAHLVSGDVNKALAVVNKALTIFRELGDSRGEAVALGIVEHITGPEEEEIQEPQFSEAEWQQWQLEQWQAQQAQEQQQQALVQAPDPGHGGHEMVAAKKQRAPKQDTGEKLSMNNLSMEVVQRRLMEIVRFSVDLDDDEECELDKPLMQLGVTSKSAVTLRNALSEELPGLNMPFTLVFDYPSVNMMAELVMEQSPSTGRRR